MARHVIASGLYILCGFDIAFMVVALFMLHDLELYLTFAISLVCLFVGAIAIDDCRKRPENHK